MVARGHRGSRQAERTARELAAAARGLLTPAGDHTEPARTPECLAPSEVERLIAGGRVARTRRRHLESCPWCAGLVDAAAPDAQRIDPLLAEARRLYAGAAPVADAAQAGTEADISNTLLQRFGQWFGTPSDPGLAPAPLLSRFSIAARPVAAAAVLLALVLLTIPVWTGRRAADPGRGFRDVEVTRIAFPPERQDLTTLYATWDEPAQSRPAPAPTMSNQVVAAGSPAVPDSAIVGRILAATNALRDSLLSLAALDRGTEPRAFLAGAVSSVAGNSFLFDYDSARTIRVALPRGRRELESGQELVVELTEAVYREFLRQEGLAEHPRDVVLIGRWLTTAVIPPERHP